MTNLQAMQDERLRDLIYYVEQLERLHRQTEKLKFNIVYSEKVESLESEIREWKRVLHNRWKELLED